MIFRIEQIMLCIFIFYLRICLTSNIYDDDFNDACQIIEQDKLNDGNLAVNTGTNPANSSSKQKAIQKIFLKIALSARLNKTTHPIPFYSSTSEYLNGGTSKVLNDGVSRSNQSAAKLPPFNCTLKNPTVLTRNYFVRDSTLELNEENIDFNTPYGFSSDSNKDSIDKNPLLNNQGAGNKIKINDVYTFHGSSSDSDEYYRHQKKMFPNKRRRITSRLKKHKFK